jgi:hypothetical protein
MSGNNDSFDDFSSDLELTEEEDNQLENIGPSCMFDNILDKFRKKDNLESVVDC